MASKSEIVMTDVSLGKRASCELYSNPDEIFGPLPFFDEPNFLIVPSKSIEPSNNPFMPFKRVAVDTYGIKNQPKDINIMTMFGLNPNKEPECIIKEPRCYKTNTILTENKEAEKVPKDQKQIQTTKNIEEILKYYYFCDPWSEKVEAVVKQIKDNEYFLKYIGPAIFGDHLKPEYCKSYLEGRPPKTKRKDELQKKVLSKARWEASKTLINTVQGPIPLSKMALDLAIAQCGNDETKKIQVEKSLRRIFGNLSKDSSFKEIVSEMERIISEGNDTNKSELLQGIKMAFTEDFLNLRDSPKRLIDVIESRLSCILQKTGDAKTQIRDLVVSAVHNIGSSLVKEGLHNDAAKMMISNEVIVVCMLTSSFLNRVLAALDKQTESDIQTNFMSKLKAAFYDLENSKTKDDAKEYLNKCFNTTKFSKHPLTFIQNAQAMVDYLHKLLYRAKSEISSTDSPVIKKLNSLKEEFEDIRNKREMMRNKIGEK